MYQKGERSFGPVALFDSGDQVNAMTQSRAKARLEVRQAKLCDVRAIADLVRRVYDDMPAYTHGEIRGR